MMTPGYLFELLSVATVLAYSLLIVRGIQLCSNGDVESFSTEYGNSILGDYNCPAGILFQDPMYVEIIRDLQTEQYCGIENMCQSNQFSCESPRRGLMKAQLIWGNLTITESLEIFEPSDVSTKGSRCVYNYPSSEKILSRVRRTSPGETVITAKEQASPERTEMTRRMFLYLANVYPEDTKPSEGPSKLLENVLMVIQTRCEPSRLNPMFLKSLYRAFIWLLTKTSGPPPAAEDPNDIKRISAALDACARKEAIISVIGSECLKTITAVSMVKNGIESAWPYVYDEKVFQWGKYDPVVDAIWLAIDTVHGLCASELQVEDVTHKFQLYMLKLLQIPEIEARWRSPTPLLRQEIFDNIFLAPMNESLAIMDACCFAGAKFSPYLERGSRPIDKKKKLSPMNFNLIRRKRSQASDSENAAYYCLQTEMERAERVENLKRKLCPTEG